MNLLENAGPFSVLFFFESFNYRNKNVKDFETILLDLSLSVGNDIFFFSVPIQ